MPCLRGDEKMAKRRAWQSASGAAPGAALAALRALAHRLLLKLLSNCADGFTLLGLEQARTRSGTPLAFELEGKRPWPGPPRPSWKSALASKSTAICRPS